MTFPPCSHIQNNGLFWISFKVIYSYFTTGYIIFLACKKLLPHGKVPIIAVVIERMETQNIDASAVLKDPTGSIRGTVHRQVLKRYESHLQAGAVLLLRQVGVFSPSLRNHYLNVTPSNLVFIYNKHSSGNVDKCTINQLTPEDLLPPQPEVPSPLRNTNKHALSVPENRNTLMRNLNQTRFQCPSPIIHRSPNITLRNSRPPTNVRFMNKSRHDYRSPISSNVNHTNQLKLTNSSSRDIQRHVQNETDEFIRNTSILQKIGSVNAPICDVNSRLPTNTTTVTVSQQGCVKSHFNQSNKQMNSPRLQQPNHPPTNTSVQTQGSINHWSPRQKGQFVSAPPSQMPAVSSLLQPQTVLTSTVSTPSSQFFSFKNNCPMALNICSNIPTRPQRDKISGGKTNLCKFGEKLNTRCGKNSVKTDNAQKLNSDDSTPKSSYTKQQNDVEHLWQDEDLDELLTGLDQEMLMDF